MNQKLLKKCKDMLIWAENSCPTNNEFFTDYEICSNCGFYAPELSTIFTNLGLIYWSEFGPKKLYPIPNYISNKKTGTLWVGEQKEKRIKLLKQIIEYLENSRPLHP